MKSYLVVAAATASILAANPAFLLAENPRASMIYETPHEFFGSADFNGDGLQDLVIVDKESGKYRLGYQTKDGLFSWVDCRPSGLKGVAGFSIGKVLAANVDALAFSAPNANQITLVEVSSPTAPGKPVVVDFTAALGPSTVVAIGIGGPGKTALADLYVGSIYNSPDPNQASLLRNDGADYPKLADVPLPGAAVHGNRLSLKAGQPEVLCVLVAEQKGDTFHAQALASGKPVEVATVTGLPSGSDYAVGNFRGTPLREFLFYKPGANGLTVRPVEESAPGKLEFGKGDTLRPWPTHSTRGYPQRNHRGTSCSSSSGRARKRACSVSMASRLPPRCRRLPRPIICSPARPQYPGGFVAFSQPAEGKFSTRYQVYKAAGGTYTASTFGSLASLADNDNITIPDIHSRIVASLKVKEESEMKLYTNTIPGTQVSYVMVPIHGGEFVMGSPEAEKGRKPDEGPQHKVRIEPFWMEQCEVTWDEYELFMYPDEEHRTRATIPTDAAGDKLADVVTHPSKPYVEMSFGMGKDGYPAIAMTQHGANKYCQWLSAKTGQFYRLPTEAEWEYACRAGTTTAYCFGDDPSKLPEYGWFEQNSDFKYQKVGKKKPNPWGLYDMCGNVLQWCLDQYDPDYYKQCNANGVVTEPWNKATKPYPHSVRGGSWDDEASACRSAARRGSDRSWKMQDPQLPKSIWYFSDAQWIGFRIIRPLKVPPPEVMQKYWTSGVERD